MSDLDLLRGLGDQLLPPDLETLRATARRRNRRTSGAVVAGAALAVTMASATLLVLGQDKPVHEEPIKEPHSTVRPLTYAEADVVHYGDKDVTMSTPVLELDLTDDGVVVRTEDGGIWFTDGSEPERIGTLGTPASAFRPQMPFFYGDGPGFVVSGNLGSVVGWLEFPEPREPELVVYDTDAAEQTARWPLDVGSGRGALLSSLDEQHAYWEIDPVPFEDAAAYGRMDLATGEQTVTKKEHGPEPQPPGTPRTVLVSHQEGGGGPYEVDDGIHMQLGCCAPGRRLEPRGEQPLEVLDGSTRKPFLFTMPTGYRDPDPAPGWLTQWIDDDSFVITFQQYEGDLLSDLLVCRVSTQACELAAEQVDAVIPEIG